MTARKPCSAPRIPERLLDFLLPRRERDALIGDLNEEYELHVRPERGKLAADFWYWRQTMASLVPLLGRRREDRSTISTHDRHARGRSPKPRLDMDGLLTDIRLGLRSLRLRPAFTVVALVTLALGIGVNTAIFSVVNGILLRPLPYPEAEQLMTVWLDNRLQGWPQDVTSYPGHLDWREGTSTFVDMAAWTFARRNLTGDGEPIQVLALRASPNLMEVLGVEAALGRAFAPADWSNDPNVLVLSDGFWRSRFGADPDVLGAKLMLDGQPYTVIGIMPEEFAFGSTEVRLWLPFAPDVVDSSRGNFWLNVIGRLDNGVGLVAARSDMDQVAARLERELPRFNEGYGVTVVPLLQHTVGDVSVALWILLGAVGFVLLIACANVANMSLARAAGRSGEMAVRAALGADRRRLLRQLLTESIILSAGGGLLGLLLALASIRLLRGLNADLPRLSDVAIDSSVLGFTALVVFATGVLFGLIPAMRASRPGLANGLEAGGRRASAGITGQRFRQGLVAAEIALALVLLVGAGLLMRSYSAIRGVELGFEPDGLLTTSVSLPASTYPESADVYRFFSSLINNVNALPGVVSAAAVDAVPLGTRFSSGFFTIAGRDSVARENRTEVKINVVTPGYFETMRTPLIAGRTFQPADSTDGGRVVVVNETMARMYFVSEEPLGHQFLFGSPEGYATEQDPNPDLPWMSIVGVVADVPQRGVRQPAEPEVFAPYAEGRGATLTLVVRANGDPSTIAGSVRAAVWDLDPDLPVANQGPLSDLVADSSAQDRLNSRLLGSFALLAMTLAAVGIYGVMSYTVSQRTREIGIRIALGAGAGDVSRSVLGASMRVIVAGLAIGAVVALALTRLMSGLLFGIEATDPLTFVGVAVVLATTAVCASLIPARRAARLDPTTALRK